MAGPVATVEDLESAVAALALVRDLTEDGESAVEWEIRPEPEDTTRSRATAPEPGCCWTVTVSHGAGQVVECPADLRRPMPLNQHVIGEVVQDVVCEATTQARPACPSHGHPLDLGEDGFWFCPSEPSLRCPVGNYWEWRNTAG